MYCCNVFVHCIIVFILMNLIILAPSTLEIPSSTPGTATGGSFSNKKHIHTYNYYNSII